MRYFLSKADTVPDERDRQKVVVQITQNLSSRVKNAHAFELPSIYIPDHSGGACKINNALEDTCVEMEQTINQSVQNNLNKLERDCKLVGATIDGLLEADAAARKRNNQAFCYGYLLFFASLHVPALALAVLLAYADVPPLLDAAKLAPEPFAMLNKTSSLLLGTDESAGLLSMGQFMGGVAAITAAFYVASRVMGRYVPCYTKREVANLRATRDHVVGELLDKKQKLYKLYLDQCASELQ